MPSSRLYCQCVVLILSHLLKPRTTCGGECNQGKARPIGREYSHLAGGSGIRPGRFVRLLYLQLVMRFCIADCISMILPSGQLWLFLR